MTFYNYNNTSDREFIRNNVNLIDYAERLGLLNSKSSSSLRGVSVFDPAKNTTCTAYRYDNAKQWFYDHKVEKGGDVVTLSAVVEFDGDHTKAYRKFREDFPELRENKKVLKKNKKFTLSKEAIEMNKEFTRSNDSILDYYEEMFKQFSTDLDNMKSGEYIIPMDSYDPLCNTDLLEKYTLSKNGVVFTNLENKNFYAKYCIDNGYNSKYIKQGKSFTERFNEVFLEDRPDFYKDRKEHKTALIKL